MSAASEHMALRIREVLGQKAGILEKKMFGGVAFMLLGNMAVATTSRGELMVRVDPGKYTEALQIPGSHPVQMGTRIMSGFIVVDDDGIEHQEDLRRWIDLSLRYVKTLPPK